MQLESFLHTCIVQDTRIGSFTGVAKPQVKYYPTRIVPNFQLIIFVLIINYKIDMLLLLLQTLGNHEFDDGINSLVSYLDGIQNIPTVVSNLNLTSEPDLKKFILPSLVFTLNDTKVGVVGYLTTDTPVIIY